MGPHHADRRDGVGGARDLLSPGTPTVKKLATHHMSHMPSAACFRIRSRLMFTRGRQHRTRGRRMITHGRLTAARESIRSPRQGSDRSDRGSLLNTVAAVSHLSRSARLIAHSPGSLPAKSFVFCRRFFDPGCHGGVPPQQGWMPSLRRSRSHRAASRLLVSSALRRLIGILSIHPHFDDVALHLRRG